MPSGCSGCITATILRGVLDDMINSYLDLNGNNSASCGGGTFVSSQTVTGSSCTQPNPAVLSGSPSSPGGVSSTNYVMLGTGVTCSVTPGYSGRLHIVYTGNISDSATNIQLAFQGRYGTGSAPNNNTALAGTVIGHAMAADNPIAGGNGGTTPFSVIGNVTGLATGTAIWIDLAVQNTNIATIASATNIYCGANEF
jgi:hypothetical protein